MRDSRDFVGRSPGRCAPSVEPLEGRLLLSFSPTAAVVIAGPGEQAVSGVATDAGGNAYAVGKFGGVTDFDPARNRTATLDPTNGAGYVAKYSAAGRLLWVRQLDATPAGVAVDAAGTVSVAGTFQGQADFDPGAGGSFPLTSSGPGPDGFLLRLDKGGGFVAANRFSAGGQTGVSGVDIDRDGFVVVSAFSGLDSSDSPPRVGLVAKFTARARNVYLHTLAGGAYADTAGLAADPRGGGVYVVGLAQAGTDLDPSDAGVARVAEGMRYLLKLDAAGRYQWHTGYASGETFSVGAVAADAAGDAFLVGSFAGTVDFNPSPRRASALTAESTENAFLAEFSPAGALTLARRFGGTGVAHASAVEVLGGDDVVVGGRFGGRADFDPGAATLRLTSVGSSDSFLARFDRGGKFGGAMRYGNATGESRPLLAPSAAGLVVGGSVFGKSTPAGGAGSVDFDPGDGVLELVPPVGGAAGFVLRYT